MEEKQKRTIKVAFAPSRYAEVIQAAKDNDVRPSQFIRQVVAIYFQAKEEHGRKQ
jgi:hypothetical protein